jgi:hypothetical protein
LRIVVFPSAADGLADIEFALFNFRDFSMTSFVSGRTSRCALLMLSALGLAGCQPSSSPQKGAAPDKAASAPARVEANLPLLKSLEVGDRACYVGLENAKGEAVQELGDFDVCGQAQLIGKRVRLTRQPTSIMAAACAGRPDCYQTETVQLIVKAEAAQ